MKFYQNWVKRMSSNNQRTFKDLVSIYKAASFVGNTSEASIMLDKEELREILHDIAQHPDDFGVTIGFVE